MTTDQPRGWTTCQRCGGTGRVRDDDRFGFTWTWRTCGHCEGTGEVPATVSKQTPPKRKKERRDGGQG